MAEYVHEDDDIDDIDVDVDVELEMFNQKFYIIDTSILDAFWKANIETEFHQLTHDTGSEDIIVGVKTGYREFPSRLRDTIEPMKKRMSMIV
jgi:hypothetical protein